MITLPKKAKYWFSLFVVSFLFISVAEASLLNKIRYKSYKDKMRVVFDLEGEVFYKVEEKRHGFQVRLIDCEAVNEEHRIYSVKDWVLRSLEVKKEGKDLIVYFPEEYPVKYKVYPLPAPTRLVIDFGREFSRVEMRKEITEGLDYSFINKGTKSGFISAHVLLADPKKLEIFPALAMRPPGFFESLMNVFTPWQKLSRIHFYKDRVSSIVDKYDSRAGINGTYFDRNGRPLGALVINNEVISYPIYNRTALIIDDKGRAAIDRVFLDSYIEIAGERYEITGVNEPRGENDIIIYTKHYGELTGTNRYGYEITVQDGKIKTGYVGNSRIPDTGYVVSFSPMFVEHLFHKTRVGDPVKTNIQLIPYSSSLSSNILHVLGGGPRVLKKGKVYVSKHYEKFRADIARGRAARTAVGVTKKGKILLVTIDGKPRHNNPYKKSNQAISIGVTLEELGELMKSIGAIDALNLDGGGSSTMVINNKVINRPADGSERRVSNALLIRPLD